MLNLTLAQGLQRYKERVSILKKGYKQEAYRIGKVCTYPIANKLVKDISTVDIAEYRDNRLTGFNEKTGKRVSPATVRLELSLLSNFFVIANIEWGICDDNPVAKVRKPPIPPGRDRRITLSEERKILRYCAGHVNAELYAIVVLALETAMRQGEILSLQWDNIDLRRRVAKLPETKNGTKRDVPLTIKARDVLIGLEPKLSGKVFSYTSSGLKSNWSVMCDRLCISDLHFHDLRHEAISRLFELGTMDLMEISAISGHKSLSMLKRYTHLKAHRLVHKLEKKRGKGRLEIINTIVPYPAQVIRNPCNGITLTVIDLPEVTAHGECLEELKDRIRGKLLREIIILMRDGGKIPKPNENFIRVVETEPEEVVIIDPLGASLSA